MYHRAWYDGEFLQKKLVFAITSQIEIQCWSRHDSSQTGSNCLHVCRHRDEEDPASQDTSIGPQQVLSLILNLTPSSPGPFSFVMNPWGGPLFLSGSRLAGCALHTSSPDPASPTPSPWSHASMSGLLALTGKTAQSPRLEIVGRPRCFLPLTKLGIPITAEACDYIQCYPDLSRPVRRLNPRIGFSML